jgi:hypothetical protein
METTKIKAVRAKYGKGKLLNHGACDYSLQTKDNKLTTVKVWGYPEAGYTCDEHIAKQHNLPQAI